MAKSKMVPLTPRDRESWEVKRRRSSDGLRRFPLITEVSPWDEKEKGGMDVLYPRESHVCSYVLLDAFEAC